MFTIAYTQGIINRPPHGALVRPRCLRYPSHGALVRPRCLGYPSHRANLKKKFNYVKTARFGANMIMAIKACPPNSAISTE